MGDTARTRPSFEALMTDLLLLLSLHLEEPRAAVSSGGGLQGGF